MAMKLPIVLASLLSLGLGSAHAQSPTVHTDEIRPAAIRGTAAVVRVLFDENAPARRQASLSLVEIPAGARWQREGATGAAIAYVRSGQATIGKQAIGEGDVLVFPDGSARLVRASLRTELLLLLMPPGAEAAYAKGARLPTAEIGGEPAVYKPTTAALPILKGQGEVSILFDSGPASVQKLRLSAGATVPEHTHEREAEILWTRTGSGELRVDGRSHPVKPGTAIYIPPGARHSFTAGATQAVETIQFYAPAGPEQRFKKAPPPAIPPAPSR